MPTSLPETLARVRRAVDERLPALLADQASGAEAGAVGDALPGAAREALLSPGKRVRPGLVFLVGELFGAPEQRLLDPACAVEMIHAASLALDDLPSMDDATTRRGRPALHAVHGEDLAILAAVTLIVRAFGVLADAGLSALRPATALDLVSRLADATGLLGLASGQLVFGTLSDRYGRVRPLIVGVVICVIASATTVFAPPVTAVFPSLPAPPAKIPSPDVFPAQRPDASTTALAAIL